MIISVKNTSIIYIGQGIFLSGRVDKHNKGSGAVGTASIRYHPWCLVAYIGRMGHQGLNGRITKGPGRAVLRSATV